MQAYLDQLEAEAAEPREGPQHKPRKTVSLTDPQAAWSVKDGPGRFSYETNYLVDDRHAVVRPAHHTCRIVSLGLKRSAETSTYKLKRHDGSVPPLL